MVFYEFTVPKIPLISTLGFIQMKLLIISIINIFALMSSTAVFAFTAGPCVSVGAGVFLVPDAKIYDPSDMSGNARISYDPGYTVNGAVGYDLGVNVRAELETSYQHAETNSLKYAGGSLHYVSDISLVSFLANIFYDVQLPPWLHALSWRRDRYRFCRYEKGQHCFYEQSFGSA